MRMTGRGEKIAWSESGKCLSIILFYLQADKAKIILFDSLPMSKCYFDYFSEVMPLQFTEPFFSREFNFNTVDTS